MCVCGGGNWRLCVIGVGAGLPWRSALRASWGRPSSGRPVAAPPGCPPHTHKPPAKGTGLQWQPLSRDWSRSCSRQPVASPFLDQAVLSRSREAVTRSVEWRRVRPSTWPNPGTLGRGGLAQQPLSPRALSQPCGARAREGGRDCNPNSGVRGAAETGGVQPCAPAAAQVGGPWRQRRGVVVVGRASCTAGWVRPGWGSRAEPAPTPPRSHLLPTLYPQPSCQALESMESSRSQEFISWPGCLCAT